MTTNITKARKGIAAVPTLPAMHDDRQYYELKVSAGRDWVLVVERPDDADELWTHWADRATAGVGDPTDEQTAKMIDAHTKLSNRVLEFVVRVKSGLRDGEDEAAWLKGLREERKPLPIANILIGQLPQMFLGDVNIELGERVKNG
jgi:hypothetical protein